MGDNLKEVISIFKKRISYLRFFVYLFLAILVLLTSLLLAWLYSTYQFQLGEQFETYYSTPPKTPKAFLYLSPKEGYYKVGDEFNIDIIVNTGGYNVNAVAAYLSYNKENLEVISIDTTNSVFDIKFEEKINPEEGKIKIGLAKPTPGINVYNGKVATIKFKTKKRTTTPKELIYFDFTKDSDLFSGVFLDDMKGTNILDKTRGAKIIIE